MVGNTIKAHQKLCIAEIMIPDKKSVWSWDVRWGVSRASRSQHGSVAGCKWQYWSRLIAISCRSRRCTSDKEERETLWA